MGLMLAIAKNSIIKVVLLMISLSAVTILTATRMSKLYLYDFDKAFSKLFTSHVEQQWIDKQEEFDKQKKF